MIDMHTHPLHTLGDSLSEEAMAEELKLRIAVMDAFDVRKCVLLCLGFETKASPNLSHSGSERLAFYFRDAEPQRFVVFATVDFSQMDLPDFTAKAVEHIESAYRRGARGLKFELGKATMNWMAMDDPRLDPVYDKAAELGIPITYHCCDPEEFFQPVNAHNFWLGKNQGKAGGEQGYWEKRDQFVSREQLLRELEGMLQKHPGAKFILAHLGFLTRQLALLADIFDRYPRVYADISAVLGDLGRAPKESAAFLAAYANRVVFGTDGGANSRTEDAWAIFLQRHFAILETDQDDLPDPFQRTWNTHGLNLPRNVLERIYYKNAENLLAHSVASPPIMS